MLSNRLKELRKINQMTQIDLAKRLDVTAGAVGLWETGKRIPDIEMILKISEVFNVTSDYLMGGKSENQIIIIGRNGEFKSFSLNEKDLNAITRLADSLQDNNLD